MQRGGLARAGGAAHEEDAVGLLYGLLEPLEVGAEQAEFVDLDRLAVGEDAHHHVFHPAGGGHGGDPQLDVERRVLRNLILPSCGLRRRRCRGRT